MPEPRDLAALQRWLQAVITHPAGIRGGVESEQARAWIDLPAERLEEVVLPSRRQSGVERLRVYGNAYYARLLECLRESFPVSARMVGEETFDQFGMGYLQQHPSTSYTLGRLGDRFVEYLEQTRPDRGERAAGRIGWPDLLIDLVRLEWTIEQVFDGPGVERIAPLSPAVVSATPPEDWPAARLITAECLRLLEFSFPLNDYYSALRRGESPAIPRPAPSWLALSRRDYVVRRLPLEREQFLLLAALQRGETVERAIETVAEQAEDLERLACRLPDWFRDWAAAQLFTGVLLPGSAAGES